MCMACWERDVRGCFHHENLSKSFQKFPEKSVIYIDLFHQYQTLPNAAIPFRCSLPFLLRKTCRTVIMVYSTLSVYYVHRYYCTFRAQLKGHPHQWRILQLTGNSEKTRHQFWYTNKTRLWTHCALCSMHVCPTTVHTYRMNRFFAFGFT